MACSFGFKLSLHRVWKLDQEHILQLGSTTGLKRSCKVGVKCSLQLDLMPSLKRGWDRLPEPRSAAWGQMGTRRGRSGGKVGVLRRFPIPVCWIFGLEPSLQLGHTSGLKCTWKVRLKLGLQLGPNSKLGLKRVWNAGLTGSPKSGWSFGLKHSLQLGPTCEEGESRKKEEEEEGKEEEKEDEEEGRRKKEEEEVAGEE